MSDALRIGSRMLLVTVVLSTAPIRAEEPPPAHCAQHAQMSAPAPAPTSHEHRYTRSIQQSAVPELTLLDQDGRKVKLSEVLSADVPVVVNFIFTTCTTICPVMSGTFAGTIQRLGEGSPVRLVSISIDPEHDRPEILKAYAARFNAPSRWSFVTGSSNDIRKVLDAFHTFTGDKSNHRPITLLRRAHANSWVRLEGFPSAGELVDEIRGLLSAER